VHIYAFGSVCRGEVDIASDIDMLAVVNGHDARFKPSDYSVYSYGRIKEIWEQGNPFAWHLFLESKMVYSEDASDYFRIIGEPKAYSSGFTDCKKFYEIFLTAKDSLERTNLTEIFDLSSVFLAVRNFATCYSLSKGVKPDFSRSSARNLGAESVPINDSNYSLLERSRVLCTRGIGEILNIQEIAEVKLSLSTIDCWMKNLICNLESDSHE
jgi:Nucleotidyltransferase domain